MPMTTIGNLKSVGLRKVRQLFVASFGNDLVVFLIPNITDALEKEQWKYVGLEVRGVNGSAQNVGGFPEVPFELA